MKAVQDSVAAYLQACTGVRTVADRTRARGEYPLLAVSVREDGTVLVDGGRQAEHTYRVTVSAASDREREVNTALLSSLTPVLLRGVPMGERTLHPLELKNRGRDADVHGGAVRAAAPDGETRHGAAGTHGDPQFGHLTRKSLKIGGIYGSS